MFSPAPLGCFKPNTFVASLTRPQGCDTTVEQILRAIEAWHPMVPQHSIGRVRIPANSQLILPAGQQLRFRAFCGDEEAPSAEESRVASEKMQEFAEFMCHQLGWGTQQCSQIQGVSNQFSMNWTPAREPGTLCPYDEILALAERWENVEDIRATPVVKAYFVGDVALPLNTWLLSGKVKNGLGTDEATSVVQGLASALTPVVGGRAVGIDCWWLRREIGCWWAERSTD